MANDICFYVPRGFDPGAMLPDDLKRYADCVNYLVHCVICGQVFWDTVNGFTPLKVAYLRKVIPDRFELTLRRWCIDSGILETDGWYIEGRKCLGYRLGAAYRGRKTQRIVCADLEVAQRVRGVREQAYSAQIELDVHRHLRDWYMRLDIEINEATEIALGLDHQDIHLTAIDMIAHKHTGFTFCNKGRIHTVVTRLARELRPALRLDGHRLCNIDIANSQPLILALLLIHYRRCGGQFQCTNAFVGSVADPYVRPSLMTNNTAITLPMAGLRDSLPNLMSMLSRPTGVGDASITMSNDDEQKTITQSRMGVAEARQALHEDERRYVELCEQGRIYEYLQERADLGGISRDDLKEKFYRDVFFGRNGHVTEFTKLFAETFPNVMKVIRSAKRKNYRQLACLMQNYESSLVINMICRRLMNEHPHVPVVTIHDSILTTEEAVPVVEQVMLEEFAGVGLVPKLKVERYHAPLRRQCAA